MSFPAVPEIPLIDLAGSFVPYSSARRTVAEQMHRACRDTGFFYVGGHGVSQAVIDAALSAARVFFDLAPAEKMKVLGPGGGYGYEPLQAQVLDAGTPPDLKEGFMMGTPDNALARAVCWPREPAGFRDAARVYQAEMIRLGRHLVQCLAESMALPPDYFDAGFERPNCSVRFLHYAPRPKNTPAAQLGAGAHTDWGAITLLYQDHAGGLEVQDAAGTWIAAKPVPGSFVVNLGDMVRRWSNDRYRSTLHRVVSPPGACHRYSIASFFNPYDAYRVACVPTCLDPGQAPVYPPCTVGEHVRMKMEESYAGHK